MRRFRMSQTKRYLSVPEAAGRCGVGRTTVWRWVKAGELKAFVTPGGHHRILNTEIERFLKQNENTLDLNSSAAPFKPILLVDDDPNVQKTVAQQLQGEPYRLEVASDGFEAGVKIAQDNPELVILDIFMPGLNGVEVCKMIRKNDKLKQIHVLAITGCGTPENQKRILAAGADAYLVKPITRRVLLEQIRKFLNQT